MERRHLDADEMQRALGCCKWEEVSLRYLGIVVPTEALFAVFICVTLTQEIRLSSIQVEEGVGKNKCLPVLPCVPGDEGVGEVLEIGNHVGSVEPGQRVVFNSRLLGTWRYYGIYHEKHLQVISPLLPLSEASMMTLSPCTAMRMIRDFRMVKPGDTIVQNGANSAVGQSVVQFCKLAGIHTINIVSSHYGFAAIKKHLLKLGATQVYTLEEAEDLTVFNTSIRRPILGLNCLGGKFEDVILRLLASKGTVVYYGCGYDIPFSKKSVRPDVNFQRFNLWEWDSKACRAEKEQMLNEIIRLMVIGKFKPPLHKTIDIQDYVCVFRNTASCEAFSTFNYVFDFTNQL